MLFKFAWFVKEQNVKWINCKHYTTNSQFTCFKRKLVNQYSNCVFFYSNLKLFL